MNSKQIVKNGVLMAKLTEYFAQNPHKKSVVVRAETGGPQKTFWRAVRQEGNRYKITEVNTLSDSYVFEMNALSEGAYQDLVNVFVDATSNDPNPSHIEHALRVIQSKMAQLKDPSEQQRADNLYQALSAVNSANHAVATTRPRKSSSKPGSGSGKGSLGSVLPSRESRLYEDPLPQQPKKNASAAFQKASTLFAMTLATHDHNEQSAALRQMNVYLQGTQDEGERQAIGSFIGTLTQAVDSTTAGGGSHINTPMNKLQNPTNKPGGGPLQKAHKIVTGAPPKAKLLATESAEFAAASSEFAAALTPPFSRDKLQRAYLQVNMLKRKVTDPDEQYNLVLMARELAHLSDSMKNTPEPSKPQSRASLNTGYSRLGRRLREAEKKKMTMKKRTSLK